MDTGVSREERRDEDEEEEEGVEAEYNVVLHAELFSDSTKGGSQLKDKLEPRTVDAYWLQREINKFMNDPLVRRELERFLEVSYLE